MTIGMNWRIWNSVRAKVDRKMPRFDRAEREEQRDRKARTASPAAIPSPTEPGAGSNAGTFSVPSAKAMIRMTWSVAKNPNPVL